MTETRPRLVRQFTDTDAMARCWQNEVTKGRLTVDDRPGVGLLTVDDVALELGGETIAVQPARTVHRSHGPPGTLGLQILEVPADATARYLRTLATPANRVPTPASGVVRTAPIGGRSEAPSTPEKPIALRYPELSAAEKTQLALRGDRDARLQVMKEGNPNLLKFLLQNPRTTAQEVATLAGSASASLELLNLVSAHPLLAQNESIRLALVKNPRAPTPLVKQHIDKLSQGQLAQLGKSQHVKDDVRRMALKLVLNRR